MNCASLRTHLLAVVTVLVVAALAALPSAAVAEPAPEDPGATFAVSANVAGEPADAGAAEYTPVSISDDGRFVAFSSAAANLGEAGPAGVVEGYVKNLETGTVTLASAADGALGEAAAAPGVSSFVLSGNGRYALFTSAATNLGTALPGEAAGEQHVYRRDLRTGTTTLVDRVSGSAGAILSRGAEATSISADGRYVAFTADVANLEDPAGDHAETADPVGYVRDLEAGTTTAVTRASGAAGALADGELLEGLALSPDGRYVAFGSTAANLVPGVEEGVWSQVYLRDTETNTTTLLSRNGNGAAGDRSSTFPTFSGGEGCQVEFSSIALNLLEPDPTAVGGEQAYVADRCTAPTTIELVSRTASGTIADYGSGGYAAAALSADGGKALFAGLLGGSGDWHLYLRDRVAGTTQLLDRASGDGAPANAEAQLYAISANGCRAVFATAAGNLSPAPPAGSTQVYVRQLQRCAPVPETIDVRIEGRAETLFEGTVPVTIHRIRALSDLEERDCDGINPLDPGNVEPDVTPTLAAAAAMASIGEPFDGDWYDGYGDYFLTQWGPDREDPGTGSYWGILVNEVFTSVGGCQYQLDEDDQVLWVYDAFQGRPSLALFPQAAHYESGPRPTTATARVGVPFPVEVVAYADDLENTPRDEPSRQGSSGYAGAEVAPVATNGKGFQRIETASPETVTTDAAGKASVVFMTPGLHRIKATIGAPGAESVIRSNGIEVQVLAAEPPAGPGDGGDPGDGGQPGGESPGGGSAGAGPNPVPSTPPASAAPSAGPPAPASAAISKPKLDRGALADGRLTVAWSVLADGAGVRRWWIEAKALGRRGAEYQTRARGATGAKATVRLPAGGRYRLRLTVVDRDGHTTVYPLGTVSVPRDAG
jgi:Tol biopolymer transport system component